MTTPHSGRSAITINTRNAINAALISGARSKRIDVVEKALDMGADANSSDDFGLTALHLAANANDVRMIQLLIRHGANIGDTGKVGFSPFFSAALSGRLDAMKLLSVHSLDLDRLHANSRSMLEMTLISEKNDVIQWLIDQGADIECVDWRGERLIMRMISFGHDRATLILAKNGACIDDDIITLLRHFGRADLIRQLKPMSKPGLSMRKLQKYWSSNQSNESNKNGALEVSWMGEHQDDQDTPDLQGEFFTRTFRKVRSALIFASCAFQEKSYDAKILIKENIARMLPTAKARSGSITKKFLRMLEHGDIKQAKNLLYENSAILDVNQRNAQGLGVLQLLVRATSRTCAASAGSDFNGTLSPQEELIYEIARSIDTIMDPNCLRLHARFPETGNTVLHELIARGHCKLVMHMLGLGIFKAMVNTSNHTLSRPLHLAVHRQDPHLMSALAEAGANLNAFDRRGHTPLHLAAFMLEHECAETAVTLGANIWLNTGSGASLDKILDQRKGQSEMLKSLVQARHTIDSAKSIFSANNPMSGMVRGNKKTLGGSKEG